MESNPPIPLLACVESSPLNQLSASSHGCDVKTNVKVLVMKIRFCMAVSPTFEMIGTHTNRDKPKL